MSEKLIPNLQELADLIEDNTGFDTRIEVLGRIQRGGSPSASDRVLAARLGVHAINLLVDGQRNRCVGIVNDKITNTDINEAFEQKRKTNEGLIKVISTLK